MQVKCVARYLYEMLAGITSNREKFGELYLNTSPNGVCLYQFYLTGSENFEHCNETSNREGHQIT